LVTAAWCVAAAFLAAHDRATDVHNIVRRAGVVNAWIAGGLIGWWTAGDRAAVDRAEGYEDLARTHGITPAALACARPVASTARVVLLVLLSTVPVVVFASASSSSLRLGLARLLSLLPLALFSAVVGLCTGGLGSVCGVLSPRHGRSLFAAVVFVPWAMDGMLVPTRGAVASIPGVLGFLASLVSRVGSGV
ncbi:MAG: hypothetical protein MUF54_22850, partial [Polyangiaceae bacterium]|nr:hypothetical protein [Polyangiaceae bacterium]